MIYDEIGASPATAEAGRVLDSFGLQPGWDVECADADSAYTQTDLKGPVTWVRLPKWLQPKSWERMRDPVCVLAKNLYGHPLAGNYWAEHCEKQVKLAGFERTFETWPAVYKHKDLDLHLLVYVDDFRMAGRKEDREKGWALLQNHIKLSKPELWGRYLGVHSRVTENKDGTRTLHYEMDDFAQSCLDKYTELVGAVTDSTTAGKWHKHSAAKTPFIDETNIPLEDFEKTGQLADNAATMVMKLLWYGRMTRWDLLRQICLLAGFVAKWSVACDKILARLMAYIYHTRDHCLSITVGDTSDKWEIDMYSDADLAKCPFTKRSTSGTYAEIKGPRTISRSWHKYKANRDE